MTLRYPIRRRRGHLRNPAVPAWLPAVVLGLCGCAAQNYSSADLATVSLLPGAIDSQVEPLLDRQLKKGARAVAHDFEFRNWKPEKVDNVADDGEGRSRTVYLYRK